MTKWRALAEPVKQFKMFKGKEALNRGDDISDNVTHNSRYATLECYNYKNAAAYFWFGFWSMIAFNAHGYIHN